jgi:hypothetical protein
VIRVATGEEALVGGWGTGSFENDDAVDWLSRLAAIGPADLAKIFTQAVDDPTYLEAPAASVVVVAAEVLAALNGSPVHSVPAVIEEWLKKYPRISTSELNTLAVRALERVRRDSELKDLWMEADGLNDWTAALRDLQARLS